MDNEGRINHNRPKETAEMLGNMAKAGEASRQTGKGALMDVVWRLRREADQLESLARAIPDNFPHDADAGLWLLSAMHKR